MDAAQIISELGGRAVVASATDAEINSVVYWERRKRIPPKRWPAILDLAKSRGAKKINHALLIKHWNQVDTDAARHELRPDIYPPPESPPTPTHSDAEVRA